MESDSKPGWRVEEGGSRNVSGQGRAGLRDAPERHSQALACRLPTGVGVCACMGWCPLEGVWKPSDPKVIKPTGQAAKMCCLKRTDFSPHTHTRIPFLFKYLFELVFQKDLFLCWVYALPHSFLSLLKVRGGFPCHLF